jgi:hypothetical protein
MEKSTKILIGVGVIGVIGLLVYKKANATPSVTNKGGVPKNPSTKPSTPLSPIIDPKTGKLTPVEKDKGLPSNGGNGGKVGGGDGVVNNPDSNSGKFAKVDPNKKDENWIKALGKKQKTGGGGNQKKQKKQKAKVNEYEYQYENSGYDNSGRDSEYDYSGYNYSGYNYYYSDGYGGKGGNPSDYYY